MRINQSNSYNAEFPEQSDWRGIDSPKLESVVSILRAAIEHDIKTVNRNLTPGLRQALRYIAEIADC